MDNNLLFAKAKKDAKIPTKRSEDAGYDIYPCFSHDYIIINPHQTVMISTGIISSFSDDYVALLQERGSTGTRGIGQRAGVIDSGYRGEWHIPITNHNNVPLYIVKDHADIDTYSEKVIYPYDKAICQFLLLPVPKVNVKEITIEEILNIGSERGNGMLGSSGK